MFRKNFDRRVYLAVGVLALSLSFGAAFGSFILWPSHREAGYMPTQPIDFNHELHAGTMRIDCQYCHSEAERGPHATLPHLSTCMKCHTVVHPKDAIGNLRPGIVTLLDHWERQEPIRWTKVADVADFVYFDHSRHINSGLECAECHGPVDAMPHMYRYNGLKMSFCLSCHMQKPPADSRAEKLGWSTRAPITCTTCHR